MRCLPLHTVLSTKGFFADRTEPTHVNSSGAECRLRKRKNVEHLYRFSGHKILLFSLHHHHNHISIVFSPPPPPHFYCFLSTTATTFLLSWKLKQQQKKISEEPRWNKLLIDISWVVSSNSRPCCHWEPLLRNQNRLDQKFQIL